MIPQTLRHCIKLCVHNLPRWKYGFCIIFEALTDLVFPTSCSLPFAALIDDADFDFFIFHRILETFTDPSFLDLGRFVLWPAFQVRKGICPGISSRSSFSLVHVLTTDPSIPFGTMVVPHPRLFCCPCRKPVDQ